jgi:hypothetical protein
VTRPLSALCPCTTDWYSFPRVAREEGECGANVSFYDHAWLYRFHFFSWEVRALAFSGFAYAFFIILCLFSDAPVVLTPPTAVHVHDPSIGYSAYPGNTPVLEAITVDKPLF